MGMGVPLFSDMRKPLRVMGAWGSGAGLLSMSLDFRLDMIEKPVIKTNPKRMFTIVQLEMILSHR